MEPVSLNLTNLYVSLKHKTINQRKLSKICERYWDISFKLDKNMIWNSAKFVTIDLLILTVQNKFDNRIRGEFQQ